jgi:hypothetical protein
VKRKKDKLRDVLPVKQPDETEADRDTARKYTKLNDDARREHSQVKSEYGGMAVLLGIRR